MNRRQLVAAVTVRLGDKQLADDVLTAFTETITDKVAKGGTVDLGGFGTFERELREAWTAPGTDGPVEVPATWVPEFTAGREFEAAVAERRRWT